MTTRRGQRIKIGRRNELAGRKARRQYRVFEGGQQAARRGAVQRPNKLLSAAQFESSVTDYERNGFRQID